MNVIEFACSHNHGRSPLAEAFASNYMSRHNITGIGVKSSGTHVDFINAQLAGNELYSIDDISFLERKATERNLSGPKDDIQFWARDLTRRFVDEEHEYRSKAFETFGLGEPKIDHTQSFKDPKCILALGMGTKNSTFLRKLYSANDSIIVDTISSYAAGYGVADFKSAFGGTKTEYVLMAMEIYNLVEKSLNRIFRD